MTSPLARLAWAAPWRWGGDIITIGPSALIDRDQLPGAGCCIVGPTGVRSPYGPQYPAWADKFGYRAVPPDTGVSIEEVRRVWYAAPRRVARGWRQAIAGTVVPPRDVDDDVARRYYAEWRLDRQVEADRARARALRAAVRERPARELDPEVVELLTRYAAVDGSDWVPDGIALLALRLVDPAQYQAAVADLRRRAENPGLWWFWDDKD